MTESIKGNQVIYTITSGELVCRRYDQFQAAVAQRDIAAHRRGELKDVRSLYAQIAANDFREMKFMQSSPASRAPNAEWNDEKNWT